MALMTDMSLWESNPGHLSTKSIASTTELQLLNSMITTTGHSE